ncbi:MAG: hypothetical protein OIF35_08160 [Cellvibrionaceae bacterium]|nr:hypothetical protein [Cellvibrionaceae bacterium]
MNLLSRAIVAGLLTALLACSPNVGQFTPIDAAGFFVGKYYQDIDKQAALTVTTGPAKTKLQQEIKIMDAMGDAFQPTCEITGFKQLSIEPQGEGHLAKYRVEAGELGYINVSLNLVKGSHEGKPAWQVAEFIEENHLSF